MNRFFSSIAFAAFVTALAPALPVAADTTPDADQAQLKRTYEMRMRLEAERRARDNEARAFGGVNRGGLAGGADDPTATQMRAQMGEQLKALGDQFACNDIKVNNGAGNTQIICGSTVGGDVTSRRTVVGGDLVNVIGGAP